jgi:hypothetical protein
LKLLVPRFIRSPIAIIWSTYPLIFVGR